MNINKYIKNIWVAACILMGGTLFNSCTDELDGKSVINTGTEGINLSISVDGMREKVLTRADIDNRRANIHDINIVFADADGNIVGEPVRITADNATTNPSIDAETTGLVSADFETGDISYHIGTTDMESRKFTDIYVVANFLSEEGSLIPIPEDKKTIEALKACKQGVTNYQQAGQYCTMFGKAVQDGTDTHGGVAYTVSLKRTVAMITLGIDGSGLRQGVIIRPREVKLCNVPDKCSIGMDNKIGENGVTYASTGQGFDIGWGSIANASMVGDYIQEAPNDHPHDADSTPLYMFENLQEEVEGITEEQKKKPSSTNYSYIQVTADYYYRPDDDNSDDKNKFHIDNLTGTIVYKFCLGGDIYNDFNIKRNTHYQLTLNLKGWGGLVEDGKVNIVDGTYDDSSGDDVSWRVDATFQTGFVSDELNVPVGGSRLNIVLSGLEDNLGNGVHIDFSGGKNANDIWVQGANGQWIEGAMSQKIKELVVDNGDGTWTLRVYVEPLNADEFNSIATTNPTLESWLENGYRNLSMTIKNSTGLDQTTFTIKQWLPLPVLEPEIFGENPTNVNPLNAELYYSRFDILMGEMMPWCPDGYYNSDLGYDSSNSILVMDVDRLGITDPNNQAAREFNREYGFHNQVAFFLTDRDNRNDIAGNPIDFNNGEPTSMMEYAIFTAVNADAESVEGTGDLVVMDPADAQGLYRYALASKEEWEKIEQYGYRDPKFPLVPGTPYWTSSISEDGMQSYVHYFMGDNEPKPRGNAYRGRMVYHKNNEAHFNN